MNKDLDERLVPNGEYRDALNIEVNTSEESDAGTVQTTMGNIKLSQIPVCERTKCVGTFTDEKNDKIYWLISESGNIPPTLQAPAGFTTTQGQYIPGFAAPQGITYGVPPEYGDFYLADLIVEYDYKTSKVTPVVVDTFYTTCNLVNVNTNTRWMSLDSEWWSGDMDYVIYPGMEVEVYDALGNAMYPPGTIVERVDTTQWMIKVSNSAISTFTTPYSNYLIKFQSYNRPLNFNNESFVTGINIIDDMLFWTDNHSEPKKININKYKRERDPNSDINLYRINNQHPAVDTNNLFFSHSMLVITDTTSSSHDVLKPVLSGNFGQLTPLREEHTTVIKRSPLLPLNLEMKNTTREERIGGVLIYTNFDSPFYNSQGKMRDTTWIEFGGPSSTINTVPLPNNLAPIYRVGDIIIITAQNSIPVETVRARIITGFDPDYGSYEIDILSSSEDLSADELIFDVELEQSAPLFEFKFPRFAYRYKYEDGEYSTFSTFTEIAFLPGKFEYLPKKGYNLGMTNNVRHLVVKDFVDSKTIPLDVLSIDILYKESGSPNIYTVKTIKREDFEWNAIDNTTQVYSGTRGYLKIESELIHAILPSNQLLRPWDNVPRKALAQEITGNRLVYGNYLQNYNLENLSLAIPDIKINLALTLRSDAVGRTMQGYNMGSFEYTPEEIDSFNSYKYSPSKSIKSLRTYQLGVVYRDKYGRETPVFSTNSKEGPGETDAASLYLEKSYADQQSKLRAQIKNKPPSWAESFKFFIKETSNEYYNLSMDRWYDAEDENIWLSFPSSERNKVDIETFLILKKEKDNSNFVEEAARYKILAIENEAPVFVKTSRASMGGLVDEAATMTGETFRRPHTATGLPRPGFNYMLVEKNAFDAIGWDESILKSGVVGLKLRMHGAGRVSDWFRIESVTAGGDYYRIDIIETRFGEDMSFTHTDPNDVKNTVVTGLRLEIARDIIENKPEFDGRFFVKIYRDNIIYERIIKPSIEATEYVISYNRNVKYIDAIKREDGIGGADNWSRKYWLGLNQATTGGGGIGGVTAAILAAAAASAAGGTTAIASNTLFNRIHDEGHPDHHAFWGPRSGWFIDSTNYYLRRDDCWVDDIPIGHMCVYNPVDLGWGESKGLDNSGWWMHLSFTKIGGGLDFGTITSNDEFWNLWDMDNHDGSHTHANAWGDHRDEVAFINKLTTSGTLFRWTQDPDQHIYRVSRGGDKQVCVNWHDYADNNEVCKDHWFDYAHKNRFKISFSRLKDSKPMGSSSKYDPDNNEYNAQYRPDNPVNLPPWYDSSTKLVSPSLGTCADSSGTNQPDFENDSKGCIAEDYTWTQTAYSQSGSSGYNPFNTSAYDGSGNYSAAPGIRADGGAGSVTSGGVATWPGGTIKSANEPTNPWNDSHKAHPNYVGLEILDPIVHSDLQFASHNPAMWETEPKEDIGLDIYHEIGQTYPIEINDNTNEQYIPIGSTVTCWRSAHSSWYQANPCWDTGGNFVPCNTSGLGGLLAVSTPNGTISLGVSSYISYITPWAQPITVKSIDDNIVTLVDGNGNDFNHNPNWPDSMIMPNDHLGFIRPDGSRTTARVIYDPTGIANGTTAGKAEYTLDRNVHNQVMTIPWFNCYSFGNGVESDRIRDDFNQLTIGNGPKASTTLEEPYLEERRGSGFIWSGIYNSTSGINNLNQFVQAEKITKDLNPVYGSIQKLHTRDTNLITLCEDKCFKVLAHKDALYKADGDPQVVSTDKFLGQTTPFKGEFGISKNPESFASESFRAYFTDKSRGAVLRLSQDGLTPVSMVGMKDWFADNLVLAKSMIGSFDDKKSTYNLTLNKEENPITASFSEVSKGWTSFKSFIQEGGASLNNKYYTFKKGNIWRHHEDSVDRNSFYNIDDLGKSNYNSSVTVLLNDNPSTIKSFGTLNYEGSQSKITKFIHPLDLEYYDNIGQTGWYVENIKTNLQEGDKLEFKGKEEKWFSQIKGVATELSNVDTKEFSAQGIDIASSVVTPQPYIGCMECGYIWEQKTGLYCNGENSAEVPGAMNYNPNATTNSGCVQCIFGCMTGSPTYPQLSVNYNPLATCDDGSCVACIYGCMDNSSPNYNDKATCDDGTCIGRVYGCTNAEACNYSPLANYDDGSCLTAYGCTEAEAVNYDPLATCDDGSCNYCVYGCTNPEAMNYNSLATCNDYTCNYATLGCTNPEAINFASYANVDDGSCIFPPTVITGCIDPIASNYNSLATVDDGSCIYEGVRGCTSKEAPNYNPLATIDDGSCVETIGVLGCTSSEATNYNPLATIDDGSCLGIIYGCMDCGTYWESQNLGYYCNGVSPAATAGALNFNPSAALPCNGCCTYTAVTQAVNGCMNQWAINYNARATVDDGSCKVYGCMDNTQWNYDCATNNPTTALKLASPLVYQFGCTDGVTHDDGSCVPIIYGCTDPTAINYYAVANTDDGSCTYSGGCQTIAGGTNIVLSSMSSSILLVWTPPAIAPLGYIMKVIEQSTGILTAQHSLSGTPSYFPVSGLNSNTTYTVTLQAHCTGGVIGPLESGTITTLP